MHASKTNPAFSFVALLGATRPPFLILTPACVFLGYATATLAAPQIDMMLFLLVLAGALCAHISVNAFNEYFDFKSGLDLHTTRTPFSGGSGSLPANPQMARAVFYLAWSSLLITTLIGLYCLSLRGIALLPLGLFGVLVILAYTPWITRHPLACLLAPGLGFGPLMVMGTHVVLSGEYNISALLVSLTPFFLVNNLLLLNQFPDIDADRGVGRQHYPLLLGKQKASIIFGLFMLAAWLPILVGMIIKILPINTLLGLLTLPVAIITAIAVYRNHHTIEKLLPWMGLNVVINIATPVLTATGILWS
ncbi:MAG: prenyltransferase [Gammaproteobacteria bacterium]|nr:prenyltransferase [Gammaproteobacteria bacterium]